MLIQAEPLRNLTSHIFVAAGCDDGEANCIARHLVDANLCGHDSHGVIRIMQYIDYLQNNLGNISHENINTNEPNYRHKKQAHSKRTVTSPIT